MAPPPPHYVAPHQQVFSVPAPTPQSAGNSFSTAGMILGGLSFLLLPIVFGPAGLILGAIAKGKGEENAVRAMVVSGLGLVIGLVLGAIMAGGL